MFSGIFLLLRKGVDFLYATQSIVPASAVASRMPETAASSPAASAASQTSETTQAASSTRTASRSAQTLVNRFFNGIGQAGLYRTGMAGFFVRRKAAHVCLSHIYW